ncbi:MAG TPA: glycosyltransferase [Nannocystis exedens]|nr:glycosyltransferase [Nannocystis exedens]
MNIAQDPKKQRTQRVDLHVHSKFSGHMQPMLLHAAEVQESYSEPLDIHDRLLARGMTAVTITDHDAIDGCLEIAHLGPHVFISEEISARFPENGCIVHVLAYGISEAEHAEIQRLRYNVYELAGYLKGAGILHSLAHPLSAVNLRLGPEILRKSLLLFGNIELINGQKDPSHEQLLRDLVTRLEPATLERWANEYDIAPACGTLGWGLTAGSDDHSGLTMARAYLEFEGEATFAGVSASVRGHQGVTLGHEKTGRSYAHTTYIHAVDYLSRHSNRDKQTYIQLIDALRTRELPEDPQSLPPVLQRLIPAALETVIGAKKQVTRERVFAEGHTPGIHDEIFELIHESLLKAFRASFEQLRAGAVDVDLETMIDEVPTLIRLTLFNMPYYFGYRFYFQERRRADVFYQWLELPKPLEKPQTVAIFTDTLDEVNGVNLGLRRIVRELRKSGREVFLCGIETGKPIEGSEPPWIARFKTIGNFPLFIDDEIMLGWPSLVDVIRWLDHHEIDLIQVSSPGPLGVIALLASYILGLPVVGQYHTNVVEYASLRLRDRTVERIVRGYARLFYNAVENVFVPSYAAGELIARQGIRQDKIHVIPRGVDAEVFHPRLRDPAFFRSYGLRGRNTLLYVGRVTVEKNMPFLAKLFKSLIDAGEDLELAIVGQGLNLEEMRGELRGYPVAFTGYLRGADLARAFASADLFVFPSTTDTFGNVVLESLASGVPALVADKGGPGEIVRHNETGWVLPSDDQGRWSEAVVELMADSGRRHKMSLAGRRYAEDWTHEHAQEVIWGHYQRVIERSRKKMRDAMIRDSVPRPALDR